VTPLTEKTFASYHPSSAPPLPALLSQLLENQQHVWPLAAEGYEALQYAQIREVQCRAFAVALQFNPKRSVSTGAKVDADSIRGRRCFLCVENLPPEQLGVLYAQTFLVLCNPMPIFPAHFTIAHTQHQPQTIAAYAAAFLQLARDLSPAFTVFYNGAQCGASAPDHLHFQAAPAGRIPIEHEAIKASRRERVHEIGGVAIIRLKDLGRAVLVLEATDAEKLIRTLQQLLVKMQTILPSADEPKINMLCQFQASQWRIILFPRSKHRPEVFFKAGQAKVLISPASVDMGGLLITPVEKDFQTVNAEMIEAIFREVSWDETTMRKLWS
jgi:ATP adenylyltransferase/5',5'''-P-1,P-4-tetraphosphate phosphorylase II